MEASRDPVPSGSVQEKSVRRGEQDLEENEEIEQIAREKGAVEAHQLEEKESVKAGPGPIPARRGVEDGRAPKHAR